MDPEEERRVFAPELPRDETPVCRDCGEKMPAGYSGLLVPRWRFEKARRILDGLED